MPKILLITTLVKKIAQKAKSRRIRIERRRRIEEQRRITERRIWEANNRIIESNLRRWGIRRITKLPPVNNNPNPNPDD